MAQRTANYYACISIESRTLDNERCKLIYLRPQRRVCSSHGSPGPVGLIERDNAQKMIRNDFDRETMFGDGATALGDFGESVSRSYLLQHNTYICENEPESTVLEG